MARAPVTFVSWKVIFLFGPIALDVSGNPWLNVAVEPNARQPNEGQSISTINIRAIECESKSDALQWADASGQGEAILLDGKPMVVPQEDCDRLEAAGVEFAYLCNHEMPDGSYRIMTVPVN